MFQKSHKNTLFSIELIANKNEKGLVKPIQIKTAYTSSDFLNANLKEKVV